MSRPQIFARALDQWFSPLHGWWPQSTAARVALAIVGPLLGLVVAWFIGAGAVAAIGDAAFPHGTDRDNVSGDLVTLAYGLAPLIAWALLGILYAVARAAGRTPLLVVAALALAGSVAYGWLGWYSPRVEAVERYCRYGAVSQAQYEGCVDNVSYSDVQRRKTAAGRYGRGNLRGCHEDSGPLCTED